MNWQIDHSQLTIGDSLFTVHQHHTRPVLLADPERVWLVAEGKVDLFIVPVAGGEPAGARQHLCRLEQGQALFGLDLTGQELGLLAVGLTGNQLLEVSRADLDHLAETEGGVTQLVGWLEDWINGLAGGLATELPPKDCLLLENEQGLILESPGRIRPKRGILWLYQRQGESQWLGRPDLPALKGDGPWPISYLTWVEATANSKMVFTTSHSCLVDQQLWPGLAQFHNLLLAVIRLNQKAEMVSGRERLFSKAEANRQSLVGAFTRLAAVLEPEMALSQRSGSGENQLLAACQLVGEQMGLTIRPSAKKGASRDPLGDIAKASRVRLRQVALKGEWWRRDNGPLLAYLEEGKKPVALLPKSKTSYELWDPAGGPPVLITPEVTLTIASFAYTFYRPFPDQLINAVEMFRFGLRPGRSDLATVAFMGIAIGLLGVITPLATGFLFDTIIPSANRSQLWQMSLALLVSAIAIALFQVTQSVALLRFEGQMDANLQAAVWDRLLSLPVAFFRQYTAGDLGERAMGINAIRQALSGTTISSILAGIFSVFSFGLLFYYSPSLAYLATGLVLIAVVVTTAAGYLQVRFERELVALQGKISGLVLQLINGITKFRVAGSEGRAFVYWAGRFSRQKQLAYRTRTIANNLTVFNAAYPVLTSMAIFAAFASNDTAQLSTGQFLGFTAAFSQFLFAALQVSTAIISVLAIVPMYERAKPIFQTLPETDETKASPGELSGAIEVSHLSFRYKENGPLILKDVSLQIRPGQFIALVGSSGSGKSTLFRLLLGFETPEAGAIYYDGQDLSALDIREVRRQMGVVLQNGRLLTGSIYENIVGSSLLTIEDAWQAARRSGLDEDIKRMPMGMHTLVSEGGGTLSGGQRQRLLIARAIVNQPRILFFDEATSALDNRTQAIVSESLEKLEATRIVIAHRLSTIINADCIFVMAEGQVVQSGNYQELMSQPGLFADLARRQIA